MSEIEISVDSGTSKRLKTAGKYCDKDILITAAGSENGNLTKQIIERTIAEISDNTIESVGDYAFYKCQALSRVDLPNVEEIKTYAFANTGLTSVVFPKVKTIGNYAFQNDKSLERVDLPSVTSLGGSVFYFCSKLKTLILRNTEQVCTPGSSMFMGAGMTGEGGYIYVPAALIDSYKTHTNANWSSYASKFRALEDYTVDGTVTGALDESKI